MDIIAENEKKLFWENLSLKNFSYIKDNLNSNNLSGSDCSIANLYLLEKKYDIQISIKNNILFRQYYGSKEYENRKGYGFPLPLKNAPANYLQIALEYLMLDSETRNEDFKFCLCTQTQKMQLDTLISEMYPNKKISWNSTRNDSDYLYLQENLALLKGSTYQKKKNHVSRFNRIYENDWHFKSFSPDNLSDFESIKNDCLTVEEQWCSERSASEDSVLMMEKESIKFILDNPDVFGAYGGVLYVNQIPAAMTIATKINNDVLDVHYEKALKQYADNGAYAAINNQFAKKLPEFLYFNREEDMGVEGLRKAKLSYKPSVILDKFYGVLC